MTDSTLGFWYFFQSLLAACCSEAEGTPRTVRANGQGGSLLWAVLCTRSRCVNRADGSSTPEDGIQRLEIWSGALCFSESVFLPLKQYLENSVDCFFNSLRLLITSEILPYREGKALPKNSQGVGGRVGTRIQLTHFSYESCALSTSQPSWACLSSRWGEAAVVPKSEGAPW